MIGRTISHFKITEKIGGGGMGVVYKADDTTLGRTVALKFLPEKFFDSAQARTRFEREARSASSLNHPNICVVHELGEHDDQPYIAMEYLEGQTIGERLADGPVPVDQLLEIGVQITDALETAHQQGIIHRDIKPANLFLTDRGVAKILDFGLAKSHVAADPMTTEAATEDVDDLTVPGSAIGTAAYMSPEQALGKPLDPRTDLFSFGIVLYEMATGAKPFQGDTSVAVWNEILNKAPEGPATLNTDVPAAVAGIIEKCLEKDPDLRYQSARDLRADLERTRRDRDADISSVGSPPVKGMSQIAARRKTTVWVGVVAIAAIALGITGYFSSMTGDRTVRDETKTIAVLPFENLSTDEENAFFARGVHEDVMTRLAGLEDLRVISRSSAMAFAGSTANLREIGERLGVRYIVEGSVRRDGNQVRVNAQLVDAETDQMMWSDSFDRELVNAIELQSTIAQIIARTLETEISPEEKTELDTIPTRVVEAYDNFLMARLALNRFWINIPMIEEAIEHLETATAADPEFAEAWALLSQAHSETVKKLRDLDERDEEMARASAEAESTLETARRLDPDNAATLRADGYFQHAVNRDLVSALRSLDQALEATPNDSTTLTYQSMIYMQLQQIDRAIETMEGAYTLDNANGLLTYGLIFAYDVAGRYADLVDFLENLLELEPEMTHVGVQAAYYRFLLEGSLISYQAFEEALRTVEKTDSCDLQELRNSEMVVAMINGEFESYAAAWDHKWDRHHANHGNWSCPAQINDEANHAHLLIERGQTEEAMAIIEMAKASTTRPYSEMSVCIFDRAAFQPKLDYMSGDEAMARREFDDAVVKVLRNDTFPRGAVEKRVLLESADMVAPDRVYSLFRDIMEDPVSMVTLEKICADPWTYPNLIRDPQFIEEVRRDGRFVEFLEHFGLLPT